MKILSRVSNDELATVYVAEFAPGRRVEFVESVQPPTPRQRKWVLIVSTLFGCPVGCRMCDAGGGYAGKCSAEQIRAQIDYLVWARFGGRTAPVERLKIQFARMGEPAFNNAVLDVLRSLPGAYGAGEVMPSVSTIAPAGREAFFEELLKIKQDCFAGGGFQMQFSVHSTDANMRDWLMPARKWSFDDIAAYGEAFHEPGDRKVTLNFAVAQGVPVEPAVLRRHFDPRRFIIKLTPVNPTLTAARNNLRSHIDPDHYDERRDALALALRRAGYDVIFSVGEAEENRIGSNCGQYVTHFVADQGRTRPTEPSYTYAVERPPDA